MTTYVTTATGDKQHILKSERELYCQSRRSAKVTTNISWSKARYSDERNHGLPLCSWCEKLGPLTEEDTRRFWRFTPEEAGL